METRVDHRDRAEALIYDMKRFTTRVQTMLQVLASAVREPNLAAVAQAHSALQRDFGELTAAFAGTRDAIEVFLFAGTTKRIGLGGAAVAAIGEPIGQKQGGKSE